MKKLIIIIVYSFILCNSFSQTFTQKLEKSYRQFENDEQLKHAISSLYVIDAVTGKILFDKNSQTGLAPASTQKVITAAAAFDMLGKDFRYKTEFYIADNNGKLNLAVKPSGDPTFGSPRWSNTSSVNVLNRIITAIKKEKIKI